MKLSILIPSTNDRQEMLDVLLFCLLKEIEFLGAEDIVEILFEIDNKEISTGAKRNMLLNKAKGDYVVFVDSDDQVHPEYISEVLKAIESEPDVIGFDGYMTTNNERRENFKISKELPYIAMKDAYGNTEYLRFNNHLSPIKRSIALQIGFKDIYIAEDYDYAVRLKASGLIETEVYINKDMYHYKFITGKK